MDKKAETKTKVSEGELELNEASSVTFEVEPYAAFHFEPAGSLTMTQKKRAFEGGLKKLAFLLKRQREKGVLKNGKSMDGRLKDVQYVSVASWIVTKNPRILLREGFEPDFGDDTGDVPKLLAAYQERMNQRKFKPPCEGTAMRMTVDNFIKKQLGAS